MARVSFFLAVLRAAPADRKHNSPQSTIVRSGAVGKRTVHFKLPSEF